MLIPKFDLYKSEWLDLVFENRNKNYGAYELRQHYSQTMAKALAYTLSGFVIVAVTFGIVSRVKQEAPTRTITVNIAPPVLPPPPKKEDKPLQPPPAKAPVKPLQATSSGPTVVIPTHTTTEDVRTDPPTIADMQKSNIGSVESKGTGPAVQPIAENTGNGAGAGTGEGVDPYKVLNYAEVAPEPNGGMAGWTKFIQRNLRYPDTDAQGRVFVSFVVERDGSLTDVKIIRSVSPELDAEALRVIRMAPKWKPGMQGGQPVRVQFNIPINFQQNN